MQEKSFHNELKELMDSYVHKVYDVAGSFPKSEQFGLTSQLQRSALSVILNYIEVYARQRTAVLKNFLEISYGSLKESKYLVHFSYKRNYMKEAGYQELIALAEHIGKMIWGILQKLK